MNETAKKPKLSMSVPFLEGVTAIFIGLNIVRSIVANIINPLNMLMPNE